MTDRNPVGLIGVGLLGQALAHAQDAYADDLIGAARFG